MLLAMLFACFTLGTAYAASQRWFTSVDKGGYALIDAWIKVKISPETEFGHDEEYVAEFTVEQWAINGNYKLVLNKVDFFCPTKTAVLDPDEMWEHYVGGLWKPVSQAKNLVLIPIVTVNTNIAYLKIRVKPSFFQKPNFAEYLEYSLELGAVLNHFV